ncbi:MAG: MFS transporter, partial [Actinobacteria bacterium]|nr:MFS transporter [Actinomycetota bacterium]
MGRLSALTAVLSERSRGRFAVGSGVHALSDSAFLIAALVAAHQLGGVTAVGIVGFFRVAPAAVMAPFSSAIADRIGRRTALLIAYLARALLLAVTAVTLQAGWPIPVFVAAVTLVGLVSSVIRPAQWALPPLLSKGPQEITPIMTAWTTLEGVGTIVGPAAAGFLVGTAGPASAIWMSAGAAA